jgi:hypothetical protein
MKKFAAVLFSAWFVTLHTPGGEPIFINAEQIDYIGPPARGEAPAKSCSRLMVYGVWVWVRECPADVKRAIDNVLKQEQN